jgi:uncharacterized membrane protein
MASLTLRIPGLLESLWYDEAYRTSLMLNKDNIARLLFHDVHNFLYNGLMYLWINIFGDSEISIRIPSLIFGYASIIIICLWSYRRLGPKIAWGVLIWLLISPFHIWYSTEAKNNAMVIFFTALIFVSYVNLLERSEWKWVILATISGVLGICTDFLLLLPLLSILIMIIINLATNFSGDRLKKVLIAFFSTACLTLPLFFFKISHTEEMLRLYLKPFTIEELYLLFCNFLPNGNAILNIHIYGGLASLHGLWRWAFLLLSSLILIIALLKGISLFIKSKPGYFINIAFAVPIIMMFFMTWYMSLRYGEGHYVYLERSLGSILLCFYALIIICGANSIRSLKFRYGILSAIFAFTLTGSILMLTINKDKWSIWLPNPDWRAYANDIRQEVDKSLVFTNCPPLAMKYYLKGQGDMVTSMQIDPTENLDNIRAYIEKEFQKHSITKPEYFYIAINRYWDLYNVQYINSKIIRWIYPLLEERHYLALDVYKYGIRD